MQSSTPDAVTQEHSDLEMRSPEEIKSEKIAFLKATAADGGRVKPSAEISFTVAKDCDELIAEGHLETYVDSAAGQTSVYVRASKAGKKFLQDLEVKAAESMSRALTKIALESPEQAISFLEGQAILSTADLKEVLIFILRAMIPPAEGEEHEPKTEETSKGKKKS